VATDDAAGNWYASVFPRGAYVYGRYDILWRTMRLLGQRGELCLPEASRELVEQVYGQWDGAPVPEAVVEASNPARIEETLAASFGDDAALDYGSGYDREASKRQWKDREATRLGEPTVRLTLAVWDGERLSPKCDGAQRWARSELSMSMRSVGQVVLPQTVPDSEVERTNQERGASAKWTTLTPLQLDGESYKMTSLVDGKEHHWRYSAQMGMWREP
jgi:CRISPR-associated endonuclease/helicase Cas3